MSYYQEGYDAAQRGESFMRCPYKNLTASHSYWIDGWLKAVEDQCK